MNIEELLVENNKLKERIKELEFELSKFRNDNITVEEFTKISDKEKVDIFLDYFRGRDDIFATQYYSDNKYKYTPHCENSFKYQLCDRKKYKGCRGCPNKKYRGINNEDITNHFTPKSSKGYGIYPLLDADSCYFLVLDADGANYKDIVKNYYAICEFYDIDCLIEISRSGNGAHLWIFFEDKVKAVSARKLGDFLLNQIIKLHGVDVLNSFDRFFPSQDYLSKEGYGNLIFLPLHGASYINKSTCFVDCNFNIIKNPIEHLRNINKISVDRLNNLLNLNKDKKETKIKLSKISKKDVDGILNIKITNDICISKIGISSKALFAFKYLSVLSNREFYEKQSKRISTYNIPRFIKLFKEDTSNLYLPRGCLDELVNLLKVNNINFKIIKELSYGEIIKVEMSTELYERQIIPKDELLKHENGILVAPPAFGKTVVATSIICEKCCNTAIIVNKDSLLKQWVDRLKEHSNIIEVGTYNSKKKYLTNIVDVFSVKSLNEDYDLLNNYGMVIIDEVHNLAAINFEKVIRGVKSKYVYGLTATPKRSDGNEKIIFKTIGDVRYTVEEKVNNYSKVLIPRISYYVSNNDFENYTEILTDMSTNKARNKLIIGDVIDQYNENRKILVLSNRIEHLNVLYDELKQSVKNIVLIKGNMKKVELNEVFDSLVDFNDEPFVILSTGKYIGEGFDEKRLDTLFVTMPFKWQGTLEQYVGRIQREYIGKDTLKIYDYIDCRIGVIARMFNIRLSKYKKLDFNISDSYTNNFDVYTKKEYIDKLKDDLIQANVIVVFNSYLYNEHILEEFKNIVKCKVNIINDKEKPNYISIDNQIIWYGSINPFSYVNKDDDSIMRINDSECAKNIGG